MATIIPHFFKETGSSIMWGWGGVYICVASQESHIKRPYNFLTNSKDHKDKVFIQIRSIGDTEFYFLATLEAYNT